MRSYVKLLALPALVLSAACGRNDDDNRVDEALRSDLALAATAQPYQPQQFVSPMEQGYMQPGYAQPVYGGGYGQPVYQQPAAQPVRTVYRTAPRATSSGTRTSTARQPQIVRRNTKRDAIIGATAGAVIGATTSRDRVKGAVIGGAAGAVLGGIIGHTVDVERQ